MSRGRPSTEWPATLVLAISSCMVVAALFWPTLATLVAAWSESRTYAHGFLVVPGTLYLLWGYRGGIVRPSPGAWGWLAATGPGGAWVAGSLLDSLTVQQISVLSMFPCLVYAIWGKTAFRQLLLPLGFLLFALPIGAALEPWLQDITVMLLSIGLRAARIPFQQSGVFITMSSGTWEVAPDCGGLRYLLPGLALGYLYAAVLYRRAVVRIRFLAMCAVALILANALRAYGIMVTDHLGIADGTDHRVFSYTIYAITVFLLAWLGRRWISDVPESAVPDANRSRPPFNWTAMANTAGALALLALASLGAGPVTAGSAPVGAPTSENILADGKETAVDLHVHAPRQ